MSDFFIQNQEETQQNNNTNIQTTTPQATSNFGDINANIESFKQKKREHYVNAEEYGVELPDGYYDAFRPILENCKTQEERQEMAYKLGTAAKYAELTGEPFLDCWQNVDALSKANFPNLQNQKGIFEATRDMITVGQNNVKLGNLGQQLMKAHRENDEELAASLMAEIDAINQSNSVLQEHIPDRWWKEAVEAGASSIPFTGYVAGAGIIGNFLMPLVGTTAATATSSYLAGGQEYIDMIANGSTPETARIVSNVSGIFQGLIEADLGITGGLVKGSAKLMGKEAAEKAAKKTIEEIGRKAFKRFHFGPVKTLVANFAMNYAENVVGEGVEEAAQNIVSVAGKELAAILDGYDLPDDDIKSIVTETMDQFKGGMLGAVFLGAAPAGLNAAADIKNYADVRKKSEAVASKEAFYNEVKDNPIFEGMSEQNKRRTSDDIWEKGQQRLEERANAEAKKIAEVQDAAEGSEELKTGEEEGEETEATPVTRDEETGRLFTQDKVNTDDNGNVTGGTFLVGNRNEENANRYGYINWEYADGDQSKIIINDFKMGKGREGIRAEAFNDFAIQHPGVEIEWNTKGSEAAAVKEMLAENNPSGKKNGLNYYADENAVADASTRAWVSKQLDEHISSIEVVDNKAIKTKLTNAQKAAGVALLEAAAKRNGMSLTEYVNKTFGNEIFGDQAELQKAALRQAAQDIKEGKKVTKKAGGVDVGIAQQEWKKYGQQIKAVIYAGENADFSTWTHELAHIFQNQLDGDLKTQAEQAFNVVNGDWQNSQYTFKDGTVMPAAEAFAYGFQDWLKTGKAENEQMKNIFQKFAEFVARAYNSLKDFINLTPEITSVYEQLLAGDDSMLKAAEMAVEAEDRRYRAQMQQEAKQAEETKKAEAEQQQKAEEAEREEASETTEYEEEKEELTPEAAEEKLQEVTNETEETANPIDNALEDTNLTDNQKDQIAETLKDDTATVTEKAEAATDAASSAYVPYDLFQTEAGRIMQYQLAGEPSIRRMTEGEEKRRIILNLVTAKDMERNGTDARTIREVTGWEKDSRNEWKYETNDSLNMIRNSGSIEKFLNKNPDYLIDTYSQMRFNLPEVVTSPQLYEVFPFLRNIRVSFYKAADGLRSRLNEHGIMLNTYTLNKVNGPASIKASIAYEIQKLIYATEHSQDREGFNRIIQGYKDEAQQITDEMNQAIRDVGNGNDYDKETIERHLIEYRKTDANIDAQMVASRILLNTDERSKKTLADSKAEIDKDIADAEARLNRVNFQEERDNEYEEAVKAGDTEKAMQMLQEEAERKGYNLSSDYQGTSAFNGAAPYRNGYYSTKEERLEAVKNEEFEDTATLGDYAYDKADPLGFEYLIQDPRSYRAADDKRKEAIDNLRKAVSEARSGKKDVTIKMYRSVPADVKEGSFRNGDWITPSKSYAKDNADVHGWSEGEYRIIEQDVDLEDIWWDGNDIAEWGYDDQKGAVYKNTENNRKLFEITYDKDGNLIPLSQRFDENTPSILFQEVFHGSPFNFDNFSTENIGSGEGAQAFGWGLYFTNQEAIARFYADKLANEPKRISLIAKNEYLKSRKKSLRDVENKEKYEAKIIKNINHFKKELKQAQKSGDESEIKFYEGLIDDSIKQLDDKERLSYVEAFKKDIATAEQEIAELKASMKNNRNLYTVDIPDEGYLVWDKNVSPENIEGIKQALKDKGITDFTRLDNLIENQKKWESDPNSTYTFGSNIYKVISDYLGSDKAASLFLKDLGYIGIDYPANSLSGYTSQDERNYVIFDEANTNIKKHLLYQNAYHGSGADFDKFDTDQYGLSGEGSMSFGYGTYLSGSEEIARDYANRAKQRSGKSFNIEASQLVKVILEDMKKGISFEETYLQHKDEYIQMAQDYINNLEKNIYFRPEDKEVYKNAALASIEQIENLKSEDISKGYYYTAEIPDNSYIEWDKPVTQEMLDRIAPVYAEEMYNRWLNDSEWQGGIAYTEQQKQGIRKSFEEELYKELEVDPTYDGGQLYNFIRRKLEYYDKANGAKLASKLLNKAGFAGIKYPAGTIHGNGNGAYNYVIFNDDDAKIVDKMLFQTQAELQDEALTFESWQDFMEYCETFHADDEVSPIPYNADAQWYQTFWETAKGVETEQEKNEEAVTEKVKKEGALPGAVDALFATYIRTNPEMVDSFLKAVADIDAMDLDSEEWQHVEDEEGAKQRERYDQLKDYIDITLSDYNWQTAIKRVQGGHEIAEGLRKRLIGEMLDNFKIRDFRDIYSQIMDDPQFAVDEADSTTAQLNKKLSKYKKFDILKPNEDISRVSPERRKRIAEALQNKEIAEKIRNGSLKLDDEIEAYLKSLDKQVKDLQKDYNELEKETKNDYQRLADAERRKLLKLHEELLLARGKLKTRDAETDRKINKGLKITEKYQKASQNMTANYDELFRKFTDLKNTMQITAEVQAALDRQEQVAGLKENLNNKQKEKNLIAEVKKMRIQLVKRAMRRVPFNRIDYENARTVIAIQRMLEPNLMGGVNRFIGIDSAYLRGVISGIVTDSDYKAKILNYLRKQDKSSQAFVDFLKKVENLKSIKDFDSWTAKERKYAIKHLPKENWVRDLNLQQLAKEREESIDLDIGMKEKKVQRVDPKTGRAMTDKEENPIYETTFVLDAADELKKLVRDAVGADMYDLIIDKPFAEWTTEELERLAQRIDELYTEGRDLYAAKLEARKRENDAIRKRVEDAIKETGITINDDDTPEEKERKAEKIAKILNQKSGLKGTEAGKNSGIKAKFDRLIHGYADANVLRVARILDNYSEGENVRLLYRREDECFNNKTRSIMRRGETVKKVMADNKITEGSLAEVVTVPSLDTEFTVDELLYFLAADKDYEIDEKKAARPDAGPLDMNDDYAATSRNAVMFGNMMSDNASQEQKEAWAQMDREMQDAIENDTLTQEQKEALALGQLDKKPGTTMFINTCKAKWEICLSAANNFLSEHPEYNALLEAIEADYAEQYERMNEISITEFNTPVHRVRAYVPLVRRESNGDTNVNQVKEDLLGAYGGEAGKQWVNKGMTQRRQNISPLNQKPVQTGLFRTWADSIDRTEHFIAYAPYVRQLNAVYKSRDASYTRRFIEARYGKPMMEYIDSYINEVANPNANKVRERGAEFLHILRGKTAPAYLGWKFSGIVKQGLTSPWPYMQFVNPAEYLAAATKCWTTGGKYYDAIKEKSAYMASRVMDPINELVDEMADNAKSKVDRAWSNFAKKGMAGLEWIDWTCVAPGWLACYEKEYNRLQNMSEAKYQEKIAELTEKNMTAEVGTSEWMSREQIEQTAKQELMDDIESTAVTYADDCTRACQPSSRLTDLAPLFKNSSEAMKAFLQFQTTLNVIWQNIRYDIPYNIRQKEFKKIVGTVCGYVLAGIFMNSVMDGVKGDDDDDDMQALRNLLFYSTTQFTDAIPMIGSDITNMMDQVITGKRGFAQSGTDMTPSATKLMSALQKATNGDFKKAASLTAEGIGLGLGAPVSGTKEIYKLLGKPLSEGDVNIARGVSDVYGIAGDIIGE